MDPRSELIREVYAQFGVAFYQAQNVEKTLMMLLATVFGPGDHWLNEHGMGVLLDRYSKHTFGQLAKRLREKGIPADLLGEIESALKDRNWLAHSYFWDRAIEFAREDLRESMIKELAAMRDRFAGLDAKLTPFVRRWSADRGITDEVVQQTMKRMLAEAGESG
jgi:hypothetical protein